MASSRVITNFSDTGHIRNQVLPTWAVNGDLLHWTGSAWTGQWNLITSVDQEIHGYVVWASSDLSRSLVCVGNGLTMWRWWYAPWVKVYQDNANPAKITDTPWGKYIGLIKGGQWGSSINYEWDSLFIKCFTPESSNSQEFSVTQTAHGFTAGQAISYNAGGFITAVADSTETNQATHIVGRVINADTFIAYGTEPKDLPWHGFPDGALLYQDQTTAGALTATKPTTGVVNHVAQAYWPDQIIVPDHLAYELTAGGGVQANNGLSFDWSSVVLGQDVGAAGDPAQLLNTREVPMNGSDIQFKTTKNTPTQIKGNGDTVTWGNNHFIAGNEWEADAKLLVGKRGGSIGYQHSEVTTTHSATTLFTKTPSSGTRVEAVSHTYSPNRSSNWAQIGQMFKPDNTAIANSQIFSGGSYIETDGNVATVVRQTIAQNNFGDYRIGDANPATRMPVSNAATDELLTIDTATGQLKRKTPFVLRKTGNWTNSDTSTYVEETWITYVSTTISTAWWGVMQYSINITHPRQDIGRIMNYALHIDWVEVHDFLMDNVTIVRTDWFSNEHIRTFNTAVPITPWSHNIEFKVKARNFTGATWQRLGDQYNQTIVVL